MSNKVEYDSQAAKYDQSRFTDKIGCHLDYMHKKILDSFIDPSTKCILEAGVGTGRFATWMAKRGLNVVGLDLSKEMLRKTKEKRDLLNVGIDLIRADVHFLPFKKGTFDAAICINVVDHISNLDEFLKQLRYVEKPKAYFLFNFSNFISMYLPIATIVNSSNKAMFKGGKIHSKWHTLKEITGEIVRSEFEIQFIKGCFIASPLPLGNKLVKIARLIDLSFEDSKLRFFSGSLFIKAKLSDVTD
jgi:2-polyprenyl-3-methyl-5-hydroxy-6-metoxy-1,4-benzoquinol methylase